MKNKKEQPAKKTLEIAKSLSKEQQIGLINLGCVRNVVDAQEILGRLEKQGHKIVDVAYADTVILNTCSFIEAAKQESIDHILTLLDLKKKGKIKKIIVAGCLAQRYAKELAVEFKGIDAFVGVPTLLKDKVPEQFSLTPQHFAYVKICESCYNHCSFCAIPLIKGKFSSRTIESIVAEIKMLDQKGVKEVILVGQDITAYGMDLYGEKKLAPLLKEILGNIKHVEWVRLLYAFPTHITEELIEVIAREEKVCKYIDVPLQHIDDKILRKMNRKITTRETETLIEKIREKVPSVILRSSLIVGFPGESDEDFEALRMFVKKTKFDKLGVFIYSQEEGTAAFEMPGQVSVKTKKKRFDILMREQQVLSQSILKGFIGKELKVLIDEPADAKSGRTKRQKESRGRIYFGRTEYDAPDVDGIVYVHSKNKLYPGDFVNVRIIDTLEYDLVGEVI